MIAVMIFFLLSGYVMTGLARRHYSSIRDTHKFYLDRVLRLYPQLLVFMAGTAIFIYATGYKGFFIRDSLTAYNLLSNIMLIPLDYQDIGDPKLLQLMPQAWSLGAEMQFYLLMPFLMFRNLRIPVTIVSFASFLLAAFMIRPHDIYGAGAITQSIFLYTSGSLLYDAMRGGKIELIVLSVCSSIAILASIVAFGFIPDLYPSAREILIGYVAGVPLLLLLSNLKRPKFDNLLGEYSYGVFLVHFPLIFVFEYMNKWRPEDHRLLFLALCVALGAAGFHFIEAPVLRLRHTLRQKRISTEASNRRYPTPYEPAKQSPAN
jgi:peptidoglycan/LPS O-acetylase OafA/YrhL